MKTLCYLFKNQEKDVRPLCYCGVVHLLLALAFFAVLPLDQRMLLGISLWIKPIKFALSIGIYCLTWALLLPYLKDQKSKKYFVWFTVFAMSFEMLCIATQAARGELSHFNRSGLYNTTVYGLMGIIITAQTIFSLFVAINFFRHTTSQISQPMFMAIRLGMFFSIFFALQGVFIGQRMAHTVGAADGGHGIFFFNWSTNHGDLRIAHFFGLHALQVLPFYAWIFKIKRKEPVMIFAWMYFFFVSALFYHALLGKGF